MSRVVGAVAQAGVVVGLVGGLMGGTARAQYGAYPGYGAGQGGWSVQVGVGTTQVAPAYGYQPAGYGGYQAAAGYGGGYQAAGGFAAGGYAPVPIVPYRPYPSPAQRQGFREGELYYETGIAPNRPLSPAEARGFVAGERRAAATPWQLDPARQAGYREGQIYWETGQVPNRPLSPAEAQGFRAGENRAAAGYGYPY